MISCNGRDDCVREYLFDRPDHISTVYLHGTTDPLHGRALSSKELSFLIIFYLKAIPLIGSIKTVD